jgi:hypothetical protein
MAEKCIGRRSIAVTDREQDDSIVTNLDESLVMR